MKWNLLRNLSLKARNHLLYSHTYNPNALPPCLVSSPATSRFRLFSSDNDSPSKENSVSAPEENLMPALKTGVCLDVQDVSNKELKMKIDKCFKGDEEALPSILEAILQRKLGGKHEDTDDELVEELRMQPLDDVKDKEFESDFEELYETDEEIDDLFNARDIVMK